MRCGAGVTCALMILGAGMTLGDEIPETNLAVMRRVASRIIQHAMEGVGDSGLVVVSVRPSATAWYLQNAIMDAVASHGRTVRTTMAEGAYVLDVAQEDLGVEYGETHRTGLFGTVMTERTVRVRLEVVLSGPAGALLSSGAQLELARDTIAVSSIPSLETPFVPVTHGEAPAGGLFDNLAEPLLMIGAVAIAVYLLFTVRS